MHSISQLQLRPIMSESYVVEIEELSKPEFIEHADITDISTAGFLSGFQFFWGINGRVHI